MLFLLFKKVFKKVKTKIVCKHVLFVPHLEVNILITKIFLNSHFLYFVCNTLSYIKYLLQIKIENKDNFKLVNCQKLTICYQYFLSSSLGLSYGSRLVFRSDP